jgi:oligosaccharyltransferase complex subunit alpha (ribophorin I)
MMLRNDGAGLKGGFSRYEFGKGVGSAITYLQAVLPSGASDVDLSDELGKITTLRVSESRDRVHALITPRFPLLRGWKAKLTLMYTIPAVHMLRAGEGQDMAVLSMSAWPPLSGVTAVEEFSMRVVLPEGASNISLRAPFATSTSESTTKGFTNAIAKQMRTVHKRLLVREDPSAVAEVAFKTSSLPKYTGPGVIAASIAAVAGGCTAVASIPTPSFWRLKAERGKAATKIER